MANTSTGNIPDDGKLVAVLEFERTRWALYHLPETSTRRYLNCKLIRMDEGPGAANLWLSWDRQRRYFTNRDDSARLRALYPELASRVRVFIRDGRLSEVLVRRLVEVQSADGKRAHMKAVIGDAELLPDEVARAARQTAAAQALAG